MKAQEIFQICYSRYRGCRGMLDGRIAAVDLDTPSGGYMWRPSRARADEYAADFEMIGRRALRRPEWKGRLKLFELYYLRQLEYRRVQTLVGVAQGTFDYWNQEVKKALGREFSRTGLFPPVGIFGAGESKTIEKLWVRSSGWECLFTSKAVGERTIVLHVTLLRKNERPLPFSGR